MTIAGLVWSTSRLKVDFDITCTLFLRLAYAMQRFRKMLMIVFIVLSAFKCSYYNILQKWENVTKNNYYFVMGCPVGGNSV